MPIKQLTLLFILSVNLNLYSQNDLTGLGETRLSIHNDISSKYNIKFEARSRYNLYRNEIIRLENKQLDFIHFSTFNINNKNHLGLGIQYRLRESIDGESDEFRVTQQYDYTKNRKKFRINHKLKLEQRFFENLTIIRPRYLYGINFPLKGKKLDIGESYLTTYIEALLSVSKKIKPTLDQRATALIGWLISEKTKLQFGIEYRLDNYNINRKEKLYMLTSCNIKV